MFTQRRERGLSRRLFKGAVFGLVAFSMFGCGTIHTSQHSGPLDVRVVAPLKADVAVGEKITGTASSVNLLWLFNLGGPDRFADGVAYNTEDKEVPRVSWFIPIENIKAAAVYDAVSKSKADVIVAPKYVVEYNDYLLFRTVQVTVIGYKGTINGIKTADAFPAK